MILSAAIIKAMTVAIVRQIYPLYLYDFAPAANPRITNLVLTPGRSSSNLSCVSTGSPPTTVTWRLRNGDNLIMRDGGIVPSMDNTVSYQMTQIITDRRASTYNNILTIDKTLTSIKEFQGYECIVTNTIGSSTPVPLDVIGKN